MRPTYASSQRQRARSFCLFWLALGGGAVAAAPAQARSQERYPDGLYAEISTTKGVIVISLDLERTPMTVANFVGLAEGTISNDAFPPGIPFFDGSTFHRVVEGHVIQGGAPKSDDAQGSGRRIPNEIHGELSHGRAGMVGMANGGPHTATNQFYITLGDRSYLDGDYTVFGAVFQGMDVVMAIVRDDGIQSVRIVRSGPKAEEFRPDTETFLQLVAEVNERVEAEEERQRVAEAAYVRSNWPDAITGGSGWQYVVLENGTGEPPSQGDSLTIRYTGRTMSGLQFRSVGDGGQPGWIDPVEEAGKSFVFVVGADSVNPGFDEIVAQMRSREKRVAIVPAALGYTTRGYYAPAVAGQRRFVISPNTMLVYEIEVLSILRASARSQSAHN